MVEILIIVRGHEIFWSQHGGHEIFQVPPKGSRDIPGFFKNPSRPGEMYHLCQFPKNAPMSGISSIGYECLKGTELYTGTDKNIAIGYQSGYTIGSNIDRHKYAL